MNQTATCAQSERGDNYLLSIVNNSQLLNDCYIFHDGFYSCLNAKAKQIAFMNKKMMIFRTKFIQKLFSKIFKALPFFDKSK